MSLLEVRNLRVGFATARGWAQAVESFSVSVDEGEAVAIVGESGSGKSVSALAIAGLLPRPPARIETGEVLFGGRDLLRMPERELRMLRGRELGFVFQDPSTSLHPLMSVGEQLEEALLVHERLSRAEARARALAALAEVGIAEPDERLAAFPHQLSGGMRQRVMIAMALICRPKLLIADEPTTALDVTVQAQLIELLRKLQRERGMAILIVTHDLALVSGFASRTQVMYAGSVVESGFTSELIAHPAHPYTAALLRSVPALDDALDARFGGIAGTPPDPTQPLPGCAFAPRCAHAVAACRERRPKLSPLALQPSQSGALAISSRRVACGEATRLLSEATSA